MLNFESTTIHRLVVHQVGNRGREEGVKLSKTELSKPDDYINQLLMMYFTKPFDGQLIYNFAHDVSLEMNEIYNYASSIFGNEDLFFAQSINIAKHLYDKSSHQKIKSGELYLVYFKNCVVDDEVCDALGIFKSENKDKYLRIQLHNDNFELDFEDGININKLDKGCLIFNTEAEHGFKVCTVDKLNPTGDAAFWKDEFLHLSVRPDDFYKSRSFIDICKRFSEDFLSPENQHAKEEQVNFMAKTVQFFEEKQKFDPEEFKREVIREPQLIEEFDDFKEAYKEEFKIPDTIDEKFEIATDVVKEVKKKFRSVIKLDKNFHVYVHSNPENMEKGYDAKRQKNFYKLYYDSEA